MKKLGFMLLMVVSQLSFGQLWTEDFEGEANGATNGTAAGTQGGTWSVTTLPVSGTFSKQNVTAVGNSFRINNVPTEGVWESNVIDISGTGLAQISVNLATGGFTQASDYIRAYYSVDSGLPILFGEIYGTNVLITQTINGSAFVAGSTIKLIFRSYENTDAFGLAQSAFDDISVTAVTKVYSRASTAWSLGTTWSATDFTGISCGCTPTNSQVAVIGGGFTVDLAADATVGGLDVQNTGTLRFTNANVDLGIEAGLLIVRSGGTINQNSQAGAQIDYNQDVGGASLQVDAGGTVTIEDVTLAANASNLIYFRGGGSLTIADDILIGADGATLTNDMTTTVAVGDRIEFSTNTNNSRFVNNGTLTAATLFFDDDTNFFTNSSTATFSANISANGNGDDNNTITNSSSGTLGFVNLDGDAAAATGDGGDMTVLNSGTINQTGTFADIPNNTNALNDINNLTGSTWNYSGTGHDTNLRLFADNGTNNFNYNLGGTQQIITPIDAYSNLFLSTSGNKNSLANLNIDGNLTIQNSAVLNVATNNNDVTLQGNWVALNSASFSEGTRTVTLDGTGTQTITNVFGETFYNLTLTLGAAANTVQMDDNVTVSNVLTLTTGGLNLNSNQLNLTLNATTAMAAGANGYLLSGAEASKVAWSMRSVTGTFTFTFRNSAGGTAIPVVYNKTSAGTESGTGIISFATYGTAAANTPFPTGVTELENSSNVDQSANVADRFWILTQSGYSVPPAATVTFNIPTAERPSGNPTLWAQRWNGTTWITPPITPAAASATSVQVAVPSAQMVTSVWVLVNNTVTLPVELISFTAAQKNNEVELDWSTASELNNDFFTIERAFDIEKFEEVTTVKGQGTINTKTNYSAVDESPLLGVSYYRLKQTDFDGKFTYSDLRKVEVSEIKTNFKVYPNPVIDKKFNLELNGVAPGSEVPVRILDMQGASIFEASYQADQYGRIKTTVELDPVSSGMYLVVVNSATSLRSKIVIL